MALEPDTRTLPGSFESADGVNAQLHDLWVFGLPLDYFTKLPAQIEAVSSADAQQAAAKYVKSDSMLG